MWVRKTRCRQELSARASKREREERGRDYKAPKGYSSWVGEGGGASERAKLLSIVQNGSTLSPSRYSSRKYILTRPPQTPSQDVPISVRQQTHELTQLKIELRVG